MAHIQWETMSTSFASCSQCLFLGINFDVRLRVVAILAQDEFTNKSVQHVLQFRSIMGSVYDVTIILEIKLGLSSQFTSKVLGWIWKFIEWMMEKWLIFIFKDTWYYEKSWKNTLLLQQLIFGDFLYFLLYIIKI